MPTYNYHCSSCNTDWDQFLKISDRMNPVISPCPHCGIEEGVALMPQSPLIVSGRGDNIMKHTDGWFKDKLKEIKKANPRSNIDV